jgi:HB1, ASXL, restriction endonuclease HTH domain
MADMPWRKAILTALQGSGTPMHYAEIAQAIIDSGYRVNVGATPAATMSANLSGLIRGGRKSPVHPQLRVVIGMVRPAPAQARESYWKDVLISRKFGNNKNNAHGLKLG